MKILADVLKNLKTVPYDLEKSEELFAEIMQALREKKNGMWLLCPVCKKWIPLDQWQYLSQGPFYWGTADSPQPLDVSVMMYHSNGFQGCLINAPNLERTARELTRVVKMEKEISVYYNGKKVEKEDLIERLKNTPSIEEATEIRALIKLLNKEKAIVNSR